MKTKICTKCGEEKQLSEFPFRKETQKYRGLCNLCVYQKYQKPYQENEVNRNNRRIYEKEYRKGEKRISYSKWYKSQSKYKNQCAEYKKWIIDELMDTYIVDKIHRSTRLDSNIIYNNPELIEQKRAIIQLKRAKKYLKNGNKKRISIQ